MLREQLIEDVVFAGASYGFGRLQRELHEKIFVGGVPLDAIAGALFSSLALAGDLLGSKHTSLISVSRQIGHAGVGSYFRTLGAGRGKSDFFLAERGVR